MKSLFSNVTGFGDLHCHIIPFVDDGADDFEDAKEMLIEEYSQGVRFIVMTPHLRAGMFDTSVSVVHEHYNELKKWLAETDMKDLKLFISREYYCDERLSVLLDGYAENSNEVLYKDVSYVPDEEIMPFGYNNCILLEFSSNRLQQEEFELFIKKAINAGLTPIVAHAERYPAVQKNPSVVKEMMYCGAYIQVNCKNILDKNRTKESKTANILVKNKLVDIVATDSHDLRWRVPNMKKCYSHLKRMYGIDIANKLLCGNTNLLVYGS